MICKDCYYKSTHSDMGASWDVCTLHKDLSSASIACEHSDNCKSKITYKEVNQAIEKQIPKKPIHIHEEYEKHEWKKKENGEIDEWAYSSDYHNGVMCERCYTSYCVCCDPDYDEKDDKCIVDYNVCPTCNNEISWDWLGNPKHCKECGQRLDWSDNK